MVGMKKALRSLYKDTMNVYEQIHTVDGTTHRTALSSVVVASNVPCRLSYSSSPSVVQEYTAELKQTIKVFCDKDVVIKAGSRLEITHEGTTDEFKCSGEPALYPSHQEITLESSKERA